MRHTCLVLCLALLLAMPLAAHAVDMRVTSSTQYLWYNDIIADDDVETVAQYLRLNLSKLDQAGKITITGYGRATRQFSKDEDVEGRLYYLYLNYPDALPEVLDMQVGRHFVVIPSGSGLIDGATLEFKRVGPMRLKLVGGRDVKFLAERNEVAGEKDRMYGASLSTDAFPLTHLEVSYLHRYDNGDLTRKIIGASLSRYFPGNVSVYADTKYDVLTEATTELLAGVKYAPIEKLMIKGEYYQSYPTFDATSIYSVFAVNEYQEMLIGAEYRITNAWSISGSAAKEDFNDGEKADLYEFGIQARPLDDLSLSLSYQDRSGYSGDLDGIRFHGSYTMGKASVTAGVDYADYRRDVMTGSETAKKHWVGAAYKFTRDTTLTARAENNVNVNFVRNYQGVVALNTNF